MYKRQVEDSSDNIESERNSSSVTVTVDMRTLLPDCNDSDGYPGLYCGGYSRYGGDCLYLGDWCSGENEKCLDTAGTETSSDEETVCQSTRLWRDRDCPWDGSPYRCRGSRPGRCASQAAVCDGKIDEEDGCEDNSDEVCDTTSRCSGGELTLIIVTVIMWLL